MFKNESFIVQYPYLIIIVYKTWLHREFNLKGALTSIRA